MRTDGLAEFGSQQQDGEHFVQTTEPTGVRLYDVDGIAGEELFEHDAIVNVLTGRDAHGPHRTGDGPVAENVIGADGLLDPPGIELGERPQPGSPRSLPKPGWHRS